MPNRILRDWTDSYAVNELDAFAERFFVRLIMKVDDFGRFHADPRLLKANLFPLLPEIRDTDISRWLAACEKAGMVRCYVDAKGRRFLEIQNFQQRMRQKTASKFPAPPVQRESDRQSGGDPTPDKSQQRDGHMADTRPSQSGLSPAPTTNPQNGSHVTVARRLEAEAYSEAEAEAGSNGGCEFDNFADPLADMAQAVATAMGLASVPEGAADIHDAASAFVDAGVAPADVADYESDYYRRKAASGSKYPLTLKILREDLPGWVRGKQKRAEASVVASSGNAEPQRPPVVSAPANYRQPKPKGGI